MRFSVDKLFFAVEGVKSSHSTRQQLGDSQQSRYQIYSHTVLLPSLESVDYDSRNHAGVCPHVTTSIALLHTPLCSREFEIQ